ncbi:MAG: hypothetical protein KF690_00655 [Bacteroidetes bacterium]|nr:hypothetical protein [Bacteroidota bacterium]
MLPLLGEEEILASGTPKMKQQRKSLYNMKTMAAKLGCNEKRFRAFYHENIDFIGEESHRHFTPYQAQLIERLWKRSRYRFMPTRGKRKP